MRIKQVTSETSKENDNKVLSKKLFLGEKQNSFWLQLKFWTQFCNHFKLVCRTRKYQVYLSLCIAFWYLNILISTVSHPRRYFQLKNINFCKKHRQKSSLNRQEYRQKQTNKQTNKQKNTKPKQTPQALYAKRIPFSCYYNVVYVQDFLCCLKALCELISCTVYSITLQP